MGMYPYLKSAISVFYRQVSSAAKQNKLIEDLEFLFEKQSSIINRQVPCSATVASYKAVYYDAANARYEIAQLGDIVKSVVVGVSSNFNMSGLICDVTSFGILDGFAGLTTGSPYYLGADGAITATKADSFIRKIGVALSATRLFIQPDGMVLDDNIIPMVFLADQTIHAGVSAGESVRYAYATTEWVKCPLNTVPHGFYIGSNKVALRGKSNVFSSLTAGNSYFQSANTDGSINTLNDSKIEVGFSQSATEILVDIDDLGESIIEE